MIFAYARVSSRDQNLTRQLDAFEAFGVDKKHIYCDKKSGKNFSREGYKKLLKKLKKGDLLVIKSIDRLGRNYKMITEEWNNIVNNIGADILVLDMPILDTRTTDSSVIGKFISDIVLQILSFVAENERESIRARQAEGIAIAKARGIKFGRPPKKYSDEFIETAKKFRSKEISLKEALDATGMKQSNFYYHMDRCERIAAAEQTENTERTHKNCGKDGKGKDKPPES